MDITQLKGLLDRTYGFDISKKTRAREYVYARRVFSKVGRDFGYTFEDIGSIIDCDHSTIIHHIKSFETIHATDKEVYGKVVKILKSSDKLNPYKNLNEAVDVSVYLDRISELEGMVMEKDFTVEQDDMCKLIEIASSWSEDALRNFIETRVMPFDKMNNNQ